MGCNGCWKDDNIKYSAFEQTKGDLLQAGSKILISKILRLIFIRNKKEILRSGNNNNNNNNNNLLYAGYLYLYS